MLIQGKASKGILAELKTGEVFILVADVAAYGEDATPMIKLDERDNGERLCAYLDTGMIVRVENTTEVIPKPTARLVIE